MKNKSITILIIVLLILIGGITTYLVFFNSKGDESKQEETKTVETTKEDTASTDKLDFSSYETTNVDLNKESKLSITKKGVYNLTGTLNGYIEINTEDNVVLVLKSATINNTSGPCINVINAKNVYIKLEGESTLTDGTNYNIEEADACIYSKDDLIFYGDGTINVNANYNDGIVSKDDLLIYSGTINVTSKDDAIKGKDSVDIEDGSFNITAGGDGIKSTNEEDAEKGIITINGGNININSETDGFDSTNKFIMNKGTITINSGDDGVHADGYLEINEGTLNITASEGLEATYVKINGGTINISASDDGINAGNKRSDYSVLIEINGGTVTIKMGQGDTDGIDSNGDLTINGGTINVTGQSAFDYDGTATYNGGTLIVNGEEVQDITNQFGGMQGGMRGNPPQGGMRY